MGYVFQASDAYTFKTKVTPSAVAGNFSFTIGAYKTNAHEMNRPDVVDPDWGWSEPGYTLVWSSNGQRHLNRGGTLLDYVWHLPTFTAGQTYEVEYGVTQFDDGSNRIHLRIDGNIVVNYFDRAKEGYTPLKMNPIGGAPSLLCYTALVLSNGVESTITPYETVTVKAKTLSAKDLGTPMTISGAGKFDRNGQIDSFGAGVVAGYNASLQNDAVKFKANFTALAGNLCLSMRAQGSLDTPWGGGWNNKGYCAYLYPNGQVILSKNGVTLFEGWATGGFSFVANTDYTIEMGTIDISAGAVKVYVKVNEVLVINYVDTVNALVNQGWFAIYSGGFAGKLSMLGYEKPEVRTDAESFKVGQEITLSYNVSGKDESDVVSYYIDEVNSTAHVALQGNVLTASSSGKVEVYVLVNGIYSDNLSLTIEDELKAEVINLPTTPIIVGGEKVTVDGRLSDENITVVSKEFSIENVSGKATIDANGEITAISAGSVRVYVVINGIKSEGYLLSISPKLEIGRTEAMAVGETRTLSYSANCVLPEENITTSYELIRGEDVVTLNAQTGEVKANKIGIFSVRVIVTGETFQAASVVADIPVEAPVVVLKDVKDMYVGQRITLNPEINSGIEITEQEIVAVSGGSHIEIEGNNIYAKSAGKVKIKAIINGVESKVHELVISELTPTLIAPKYLPKGDFIDLSCMFNFEEFEPVKIVYSIVSGQEFANIEGNRLIAKEKIGKVKLKIDIYDVNQNSEEFVRWSLEETIEVSEKLSLVGVPNADGNGSAQIVQGAELDLSFLYTGDEEIKSVKFVLVSGNAKLTQLTLEEGQTLKDTHALLKLNAVGQVKLKVVINDEIESPVITITVISPKMDSLTKYITIIVVVGVILIAGVATLTILLIKKKKSKAKESK